MIREKKAKLVLIEEGASAQGGGSPKVKRSFKSPRVNKKKQGKLNGGKAVRLSEELFTEVHVEMAPDGLFLGAQ